MAGKVKKDWSDRINPMLIKEVRQQFHNRGVLMVMGGLLVGQLILLVAMQYGASGRELSDNGTIMFGFVVGGMTLAAYITCALGTLTRFSAERRDRELDFTFLTILTPNRIVWGKLAGASVMMIFIFALCLPFMVIAYFLRGIAMGDMLLISLMLLPPLFIAAQLGILIGAAGKRWLAAVFVLLTLFGSQFLIFIIVLFSDFVEEETKIGGMILWCTICGIIVALLYVLSVAAVNSRHANRMFPVRLALLGIIALSPLLGFGLCLVSGGMDYRLAMGHTLVIVTVVVAGFCATLAAFERLDPGERVLRKRPRNLIGRFTHFLLSSGAASGIVLSYLLLLFAVFAAFPVYLNDPIDGEKLLLGIPAGSYFVFYANVALLLAMRRKGLPGMIWWCFVIVAFLVVPLVIGGLLAAFDEEHAALYLISTPFCVSGFEKFGWLVVCFGPALALFSGLLLILGFRKRRRVGHE